MSADGPPRGARPPRGGGRQAPSGEMSSAGIHDALKEAYEAVAYDGRPNACSHPDRLRAIAILHGLDPLPADAPAVLELGCGDGSNLLPMAAALPRGRFVGIDLSERLIASARAMAEATGLTNVTLLHGDARTLAPGQGTFDAIIAHGFYSWVPADVREAMFATMARQLSPTGVGFVSYNLLPGCWIRRIGWDAMAFAVRNEADPARRVAGARDAIGMLVEAWRGLPAQAGVVADSFARETGRTDGGFAHDNLSAVNEPVYHVQFDAHARRHGLAPFADAEPMTLSRAGVGPALAERIARADAVGQAQWLDFVHARTLRQSLVVPVARAATAALDPAATARLHYSATAVHMQRAMHAGAAPDRDADPVGRRLAEAFPAPVPYEALASVLATAGVEREAIPARVLAACIDGVADVHATPIPMAVRPTSRPRATAMARWQAAHRPFVANLRHVSVRLADATAARVLALCDGSRSPAAMANELADSLDAAERGDARTAIDLRLGQLASAALLEA